MLNGQQVGFVIYNGIALAIGAAGAGRHQWDVSVAGVIRVGWVRTAKEDLRHSIDAALTSPARKCDRNRLRAYGVVGKAFGVTAI